MEGKLQVTPGLDVTACAGVGGWNGGAVDLLLVCAAPGTGLSCKWEQEVSGVKPAGVQWIMGLG